MGEPSTERRAEKRRRQLKSGSIVFNRAASVYDCVVRNVSPAGACLALPSPQTVPAQFELRTEAGRHGCEVIWRGDDRIGVKFDDYSKFRPNGIVGQVRTNLRTIAPTAQSTSSVGGPASGAAQECSKNAAEP